MTTLIKKAKHENAAAKENSIFNMCYRTLVKLLIISYMCQKFASGIGGNQSDWLVTRAQVHQCRVEHKHNIEQWRAIENPIGIPFNNKKKIHNGG